MSSDADKKREQAALRQRRRRDRLRLEKPGPSTPPATAGEPLPMPRDRARIAAAVDASDLETMQAALTFVTRELLLGVDGAAYRLRELVKAIREARGLVEHLDIAERLERLETLDHRNEG